MWRAADEMLDRQVAVKEMRIDGLDPEDTRTRRERTLREARATARIDHPNVVRVYDVVDEGERLWIVMELVAGRSLERMLADDGAVGPREVACIGLGLVAALRQVHAGGVLHRDIKPGNVLVESHGHRVVLTDFGIAAIQDATALTVVGMLVGSPDYMAPERISGHPQGPPSDIWSLGATLCAALGGRSPFSRDTTLATLHAVLYEEPELPSSAGPLRDILAALLRKQPGRSRGWTSWSGFWCRWRLRRRSLAGLRGRGVRNSLRRKRSWRRNRRPWPIGSHRPRPSCRRRSSARHAIPGSTNPTLTATPTPSRTRYRRSVPP